MALRFTKTNSGGTDGGTYDHSLLINRGLPDQHTIESITGLRDILNKKYEKPFGGIPKSDLGFDVATLTDIDNLRKTDIFNINNQLALIIQEITEARGDEKTLKEYIDTKVSYSEWSGSGGTGTGGTVGYPLYHNELVKEGQLEFNFDNTYQMGTNQLEVYLNGLLMNLGTDYIEKTDTSIEFLFELEVDDRVVAMVRSVISTGLHEEYVATEGQTEFTLMNPYAIYQNILQVYVNGVLQRKGLDYLEVNDLKITFKTGLRENDFVTFHQSGSTDPIAGVVLESEIGRLKISNAMLSISIQEATGIEQTNYADTYVDTFLTLDMIDVERSFDFNHVGHSITPSQSCVFNKTNDEFNEDALLASADATSFTDRITLANEKGGVHVHSFGQVSDEPKKEYMIADSIRILQKNRSQITASIQRTAVDVNKLILAYYKEDESRALHKIQEVTLVDTTDMLSDLVYSTLNDITYIAYVASNTSGSAVFLIEIRDETFSIPMQLTDYVDKATSPCLAFDGETLAAAFTSRRVNANTDNIDYVILKNGSFSGVNHIVSDTVLHSNEPCIEIMDGTIYIAYSSQTINLTNYNIRLSKIDNGVISSIPVTNILSDNTKPVLRKGKDNILRIAWLSRRISDNYGVDFVFVYPDGDISSVQTIMSGTSSIECEDVSMEIDHEDSAHIVHSANQINNSLNNIIYTYVTSDNVVTQFGNIKNHSYNSIELGSISINHDTVLVNAYSVDDEYSLIKSVANYAASGYYVKQIDSVFDDTEWLEIKINDYIPAGTNIEYEVRASNDLLNWSPWVAYQSGDPITAEGRYLELRAHLSSAYVSTPEIYQFDVSFRSKYIELYTKPIKASKDVQNAIVIAKHTGDVSYEISKDNGVTFRDVILEHTTNLLSLPSTQEFVLKATMHRDSVLDSWALIW